MQSEVDSDFEFAQKLQNEEVQSNVQATAMNAASSTVRKRPDVCNNPDAKLAHKLQKIEVRRQHKEDSLMAEQVTRKESENQNSSALGASGGDGYKENSGYNNDLFVGASFRQDEYDDQQVALQLQEQLDFEQNEQDALLAQRLADEDAKHGNVKVNKRFQNLQGNQSLLTRVINRQHEHGRQDGLPMPLNIQFDRPERNRHESPFHHHLVPLLRGQIQPRSRLTPPMPHDAQQHAGFHRFPTPGNQEFTDRPFLEFDPLQHTADNDDQFVSMTHDPSMLVSLLMTRAPGMMVPNNVDLGDYESLWDLAERLGEVKKCGASKEEIGRLPVRQYNQATGTDKESDECCVCLSKFSKGEKIRTLPCLHNYHKNCIDRWLKRNAICPVCRESVKEDG